MADVLEHETAIRAHAERGDIDAAAALAIKSYGPELHGYLVAVSTNPDLAGDAFAIACEQLWKNLPTFRWEATLRTWAYQIGRNALLQLQRQPARRREYNLPLSVQSSVEAVPRSQTAPYQRTAVKDAMRELRAALSPDDHELLLLRLDRGMSWRDIAVATSEGAETATVDQRAATLRKRYERVKLQLRELAVAHGLLETDG